MVPAVGHVNVIGITAIEIGCKITAAAGEVVATIEDRMVLGGTLVEVADITIIVVEAVTMEEKIEATTTGTIDKDDPVVTTARSRPLFDIAVDAIARTQKARHRQAKVDQ